MDAIVSLPTLLAILGLALAAMEIAIFGFGTVFLLFFSIGLLTTSGLMFVGVLPETWISAAASVGVVSLIAALLLWKPLRAMQADHQSPDDQPNVFSGLSFRLSETLTHNSQVKHRYSGIDWLLVLEDEKAELPVGTEVEVVKTGVGKMHVVEKRV